MKKRITSKTKKTVSKTSGVPGLSQSTILWQQENLPLLAGFVIIAACFILTLTKLSSVTPQATSVIPIEETEQLTQQIEPVTDCVPSPEVFSGIGARLEQISDKVYIQELISGSPAEINEIVPGDVIYRVDDTPVVDVNDAVTRIRGEVGVPVRLILYRGNLRLDKTIVRGTITDDQTIICK